MDRALTGSNQVPLRTLRLGDWTLHEYGQVDSTNLVAAGLTAWEAIRAESQTAGRGRFQRRWISGPGGLWLSAVLPLPTEVKATPLVVGLAVCNVLRSVGVARLRMRWPNDVLVEDRKLAGLLLDQFKPGLVVAGVGINVSNDPEASDASLKNTTARLADLVPVVPGIAGLTERLLKELRGVILALHQYGFMKLLPQINELWGGPRPVELDLDGTLKSGSFDKVDGQGRLVLQSDGTLSAFEPSQVRHLREL